MDRPVLEVEEQLGNHLGDLAHFLRAHPSCRDRGCPQPNATGVELARRIEGDRVAVDGDADGVEGVLDFLSGQVQRSQVDQHQVVVGAAADQPQLSASSHFCECVCAVYCDYHVALV